MNRLLKYAFSNFSSRTTIPPLLKNPKYTRLGYQHTGSRRVQRKPSVDPTLVNSHLYYNYTEGLEMAKQYQVRQPTELKELVSIITNETYLEKQDMKLFKALKAIMIHHPQEIVNHKPEIERAYLLMIKNLRYLPIHNVKTMVLYAQQYFDNQSIWKTLFRNTVSHIVAYEHRQTPFLSKVLPKHDQEALLYCLHQVVKRNQDDLSHLSVQLDLAMRNHLRFSKIHPKEAYNQLSNIEGNTLALYLGDYISAMEGRDDFFNEYDEDIKLKQVKAFLKEGLDLLKGVKLNEGAKKYLDQVLEKSRYK